MAGPESKDVKFTWTSVVGYPETRYAPRRVDYTPKATVKKPSITKAPRTNQGQEAAK